MRRRIRRKTSRKPELTESEILAWADAFHKSNGWWPKEGAEPQTVVGTLGERWKNVDDALRRGLRGLEGGSSLARLLATHRGVRNSRGLPQLTVDQILSWADAYYDRTGRWPSQTNWYETIVDSNGEKWMYMEAALQHGLRGLPGGSSLAQLLAEFRGVRNKANLPHLTVKQILQWAEDFYQKTGQWPKCRGLGEIDNTTGETWFNIDQALRKGLRGLAGGSSLAIILRRYRIHRTNGDGKRDFR